MTNDGQHSYQYDAENRVVSVDSGAAQYRYDHQNRRVCKITGASWAHFIYEGNQCVAEHNGTQGYSTSPTYEVNSARADYAYYENRLIYRRQRASGGGPWTTNYYWSDRLSARLVLDAGGNVIGRQGHLPYGEDFAESGLQEKHHFTSYERDLESGTDHAVNRAYSPSAGRFQQADLYRASGYMVNPQSWNRYSYVQNNPVDAVGPSGLDSVPISRVFLLPGGGIAAGTCTEARCFWDLRLLPVSENEPRRLPVSKPPKKVDKHYSWKFPCNKDSVSAGQELQKNFTELADYRTSEGSYVRFDDAEIVNNAVIRISTSLVVIMIPDFLPLGPTSFHVQVIRQSPTSWVFGTQEDHPFYPGTIQFSIEDAGNGEVKFAIDLEGCTNGSMNTGGHLLGRGGFEDPVWAHLSQEVKEKICGNKK